MVPDLKTHALLHIAGPEALPGDLPRWAVESLRRAPWLVVRRAQFRDGLIPVGVRGESREERFPAWISPEAVLETVDPQTLALRRAWMTAAPARRAGVPALAALDDVEKIMAKWGLEGAWGPAGSVGFELASNRATATVDSDLDLIVESPTVDAGALWAALAALPVRVDVLLETLYGAVALQEYARARSESSSFMLRTKEGPRLTRTLEI
jgi:phosphoribosyl-dephospho-CoA transferase